MSNRAKYALFATLDFALTFGGPGAVIALHLLDNTRPASYRASLSVVVVVIAAILSAKAIFEHGYRRKYDNLLQQLAMAMDAETKERVAASINALKTANTVYARIVELLPFAILYVVSWLGEQSLASIHATCGLILVSMGAGTVFGVIKCPIGDKAAAEKYAAK